METANSGARLLVIAVTSSIALTGCESTDDADESGINAIPLTEDLCLDATNMDRLGDPADLYSPNTFGEVQLDQVMRMAASPTEGPFYMVNLIRYRERARYADGRETNLTGREADALYAPVEFLSAIGARVVFQGEVGDVVIGGDGVWETVSIVEYPCPVAFFAMLADPGFRDRSVHKEAGVEETIVMATDLLPSPLPDEFMPPDSPFPPTAEDPSFEMIHVLHYREEADYGSDATEPLRTGREAMDLYSSGAGEAAGRIGVFPTAWFAVQGVVIGDGRPWDEVRLNRMPSLAGFESLVEDPTRVDDQYHRDAALDDTYSLITYPQISRIPGAPDGSDTMTPVVTSDGVGTICMTDNDCPGGGVDTCINPEGMGGFCTREGCSTGGCESPYACCRGCSDAVASLLPFSGSACVPSDLAATLTAAPAACTCD